MNVIIILVWFANIRHFHEMDFFFQGKDTDNILQLDNKTLFF